MKKLFNLISLQEICTEHLKLNKKMTLEIADNLYSNSIISYPYTKEESLPESIKSEVWVMLNKLIPENKLKNIEDVTCFKNNESMDHYAIIPWGVNYENRKIINELRGHEKDVYNIILERFISVFTENT